MTTALIFPGQGAQAVGMGRELHAASAAARAMFERADAALGLPLARVCFEGPEEQLTATEFAQPAILATSIAALAALADSSDVTRFVAQHACFVAGHSLGEYTALVAAGALDLETALRLVRRRGELMATMHEGAMAAVIGLDEVLLEGVCQNASSNGTSVVVANYNAPGQLVISGASTAVERASELARERGARRVIGLRVSAAFHSPLMRAAADALAPAILAAPLRDAQVPVMANVTAEPISTAAEIRRELLMQVTASVRWTSAVQRMAEAGVTTFVEVGPGSVLAGLVRRIVPSAQVMSAGDVASVTAVQSQWTS